MVGFSSLIQAPKLGLFNLLTISVFPENIDFFKLACLFNQTTDPYFRKTLILFGSSARVAQQPNNVFNSGLWRLQEWSSSDGNPLLSDKIYLLDKSFNFNLVFSFSICIDRFLDPNDVHRRSAPLEIPYHYPRHVLRLLFCAQFSIQI